MKRALKYLLYLLCVVVAVVGVAVADVFYASNQRLARTFVVTPPAVAIPHGYPVALERGRYLVHRVSLCIECHGEDWVASRSRKRRSPAFGEPT